MAIPLHFKKWSILAIYFMNEIGRYTHNNKTFKIFLSLLRGGWKTERETPISYSRKYKFTLKIRCYAKEMFEHFVNAWNLNLSFYDRTRYENLDWNSNKYNHCLLFRAEDWHEIRQFLIIVEKYLNDRDIELKLNNEMIGAILMMRELG